MRTDQLVAALVADRTARRPLAHGLVLTLAAGGALSLGLFFLTLGLNVIARRVKKDPPSEGGWNIFHTGGGGATEALPFSATSTLVACPFICATNLSAVASMIGNEP